MGLTPEAVSRLIEALDATDTAYILGAGASTPEVPVMRELIQRVLRDFSKKVTGFVVVDEPTPMHYVFADTAVDEDTRQDLLATNISTLRFLIGRELKPAPTLLVDPPPQYRVLSLAKPSVAIINYNVDGLAGVHCPNARVLCVHGEVPEFVTRLPLREAVQLTQEGIDILPPETFWLPQAECEPDLIRQIDPAYRSLLQVATIVIIGYSFGLSSSGIMDSVSFEALRAYCRGRKVCILVVDPRPWGLAETLGETLKNIEVLPVPACWNLLCKAMLNAGQQSGVQSLDELRRWTREIVRRYERLLD